MITEDDFVAKYEDALLNILWKGYMTKETLPAQLWRAMTNDQLLVVKKLREIYKAEFSPHRSNNRIFEPQAQRKP